MQRTVHGVGIENLMKAYGHSSPAVTLAYICLQDEELAELYSRGVLRAVLSCTLSRSRSLKSSQFARDVC